MPRLLACLLLATSTRLLADDGILLLHKQSPPFVITVFVSPVPPRVGAIDLSVLVQRSETLDPVLDADVSVDFAERGSKDRARLTHDQSRNKLLYAASVHLDDPGEWHYTVSVHTQSAPVAISGVLEVAAEQPKLAAYWSYLALPFLCLAIFVLHQWLASKRLRRTSRSLDALF